MAEWRVGGKLKRTLYRDDQLVGLVDTPEIAAEIVEALNGLNYSRGQWTAQFVPAGVGEEPVLPRVAPHRTPERRPGSGRERSPAAAPCGCQLCQSGEDRYESRCGVCDALVTVVRGRVEQHGTEETICVGSGEEPS